MGKKLEILKILEMWECDDWKADKIMNLLKQENKKTVKALWMKELGKLNFLHQHPSLQEKLKLDINHLIVDRKDWEEVILLLEGRNIFSDEKLQITISKSEYDRLIKSQRWLECLNAAGVDNWGGIEEAYNIKMEWDNEKI